MEPFFLKRKHIGFVIEVLRMEILITVSQTVNVFMARETAIEIVIVLVELIVEIIMVSTLEWLVGQMCVCLTLMFHHNQHHFQHLNLFRIQQ